MPITTKEKQLIYELVDRLDIKKPGKLYNKIYEQIEQQRREEGN